MQNWIYQMRSDDPAPAGDGDTGTWFQYYKWGAKDGETFVPKKWPFLAAQEGDRLWFVLDETILGYAPLLRVETPAARTQSQELWYDASKTYELEKVWWFNYVSTAQGQPLPEDHGALEEWLNTAVKRA